MQRFSSPGVAWFLLVCFLATVVPWPGVRAGAMAQATDNNGSSQPTDKPAGTPAGAMSDTDCRREGKELARTDVSTGGSFAGGVGLSLLLPFFGVGVAYLVAGKPSVPYDLMPEGRTRQCQSAFIEGYQKEGRSKKRRAALIGGLVGTAVAVGATALFLYALGRDTGESWGFRLAGRGQGAR